MPFTPRRRVVGLRLRHVDDPGYGHRRAPSPRGWLKGGSVGLFGESEFHENGLRGKDLGLSLVCEPNPEKRWVI